MERQKAIFYGFNPPFIGGQQKYLSRQEDERLIKNDILQLLLTNPGERVMRPDFGLGLRNLVFENFGSNESSSLRNNITRAIQDNDPRVVVREVNVSQESDNSTINIRIVISLIKDPSRIFVIERAIRGQQ